MLKITFIIIGTIIGAGFASGREIYTFFGQYGNIGLATIAVTGIIISLIIYKVLNIINKYEINNYDDLTERINNRHPNVNNGLNIIVNSFLLISFYIMIAGFSSYIKQTYNIPTIISNIIFVVICYLVFKRNVEGLIKISEILVPVLILLILLLGIKNIPYITAEINNIKTSKEYFEAITSGFLYASYNSIIVIPVLTGLRNYIKNKKQIIKISIISGVIITTLALTIYILLLKETYFIHQLEMPLAQIATQFGKIFQYMYGFIIVASIFTSCISAGYSFLNNVTKNKSDYNKVLILICTSAVFAASIGFGKLVEILYPLFGILGIWQIGLLFFNKSLEKN